MKDEQRICRRHTVSGRVQGVAFRAHTRAKALTLELTGYACNRPDGTVEVFACGSLSAVEALSQWLWQGSPASRVTAVTAVDVTVTSVPSGFVVY